MYAAGGARVDVDAWARALDLPIDDLVADYSAGMRRKLALAGVLALARPVLVLDEPQNALDLESNQLLGELLRAYAAGAVPGGAVVLVTSHVLEALATACDRVHLLDAGVMGGSYAPGEFAALAERLVVGTLGERVALARGRVTQWRSTPRS